MKTFLIIAGLIVLAGIIYLLFFSNGKVKKLQKEAERHGWTFVGFKKVGKYRDYVYQREEVTAVLSWQYKGIFCCGKAFRTWDDLDVEFVFFKLQSFQREKYKNALIMKMAELADHDLRTVILSGDEQIVGGISDGADRYFNNDVPVDKAAKELLGMLSFARDRFS